MLNIMITSRHIRPILINVIHRTTNSRGIHIETEMKKLNDRKEFAKVIALFNKHKHQESNKKNDHGRNKRDGKNHGDGRKHGKGK